MQEQDKVKNSFRFIIDMQGYEQHEYPFSFGVENALKFFLTELNCDDMEGFNDVWAHALNSRIIKDNDINCNSIISVEESKAYNSNRIGSLPYSTIHTKVADVSSNFTITFTKGEKDKNAL